MKHPRDQAEALLRKAANDLIAADLTLATQRAPDTVCFHTQQATEKGLKAILALHDISYSVAALPLRIPAHICKATQGIEAVWFSPSPARRSR
jgi:hypothetical protein